MMGGAGAGAAAITCWLRMTNPHASRDPAAYRFRRRAEAYLCAWRLPVLPHFGRSSGRIDL